jgi:hypothetical protein
VELDRRLRGDLGQLVGRESVKRWALRQKARDLAQTRVQLILRWPAIRMIGM